MLDVRTLALGCGAFCASFGLGWWLGLGNMVSAAIPGAGTSPPAAVTVASPQPSPATADVVRGKGLTTNDGLRRTVLWRAKVYQRPPCNQDVRTLYVGATTIYAETLMRAAGCNSFPRCRIGEEMLAEVWRRNRSAADVQVARAMAAVNRAGGLSERSFRGDIGRAVRVIAGTGFKSGPGPACVAAARSPSRRPRWMTKAVVRGVARGLLATMKRRRSMRFRFRFRR